MTTGRWICWRYGVGMHRHRAGTAESASHSVPAQAGTRRAWGFTLIELMIAVAVVAILAAIAYPTYQDSIRKGRRAEGKSALAEAASRQEQYYSDNKSYTNDMTDLGYAASPAVSPDGYYQISATGSPGGGPPFTGFTLTAAPQGAQTSDTRCGSLTLASNGQKSATGPDGAKCW